MKNPPRLMEAVKHFNIGKETLVEFLTEKGFVVVPYPSTILTPEMYAALQQKFELDKFLRQKRDEIRLQAQETNVSINASDSVEQKSNLVKEDDFDAEFESSIRW